MTDPAHDPADVAATAMAEAAEAAGPPAPRVSSWEPVDLAPVLAGQRVTPAPSVFQRADGKALLYAGRINLFLGETESCKTWGAAIAAAQELDAGHHVVVLDFEDTPESLVERLTALGTTREAIARHLTYIQPAGPLEELDRCVVDEIVAGRGTPSLVVGDSVNEAMSQAGLDPYKPTDVSAFYAGFPRSPFANLGAAVLLTDHVTKDRETRGRWAIGSERKLSGIDGAAYAFDPLTPFGRERTATIKITVSKDRLGHVRQHEGTGRVIAMLELQSWPDGGVTYTAGLPEETSKPGAGFHPTHLMERISKVVDETPGLSVRALRAAVKGKNDAKDLALELLVAEGYVEARSGPRGAREHHCIRPYQSPATGEADDAGF